MIECPWCHHNVEIQQGKCPQCRQRLYEVSERDFADVEPIQGDGEEDMSEGHIEGMIEESFTCRRCRGEECIVKEVAMTGTGLSKLLDIQHHHYLFVSCAQCGSVEIYDPEVLRGRKPGQLGTILDTLFGR
ncbi:zinc ribbon domain-containing protein [Paenibacillus puerhi]|uniref:zinc ribbon domain-containing protein n=1 Tax=Paenibacillus puerhi TaxID=2692622 RepID=UPI001F465646|nr:zinc ribbon domain-containing protein [Paenibacillus puerhi]